MGIQELDAALISGSNKLVEGMRFYLDVRSGGFCANSALLIAYLDPEIDQLAVTRIYATARFDALLHVKGSDEIDMYRPGYGRLAHDMPSGPAHDLVTETSLNPAVKDTTEPSVFPISHPQTDQFARLRSVLVEFKFQPSRVRFSAKEALLACETVWY